MSHTSTIYCMLLPLQKSMGDEKLVQQQAVDELLHTQQELEDNLQQKMSSRQRQQLENTRRKMAERRRLKMNQLRNKQERELAEVLVQFLVGSDCGCHSQ